MYNRNVYCYITHLYHVLFSDTLSLAIYNLCFSSVRTLIFAVFFKVFYIEGIINTLHVYILVVCDIKCPLPLNFMRNF